MTYADTTKVPVGQTRMDIEKLLAKHGAQAFGFSQDGARAVIAFRMKGLSYRFTMAVPDEPQAQRSKWRALLLVIKARLEGVESGIETMEDAFLANTVMADGATVAEWLKVEIKDAAKLGRMPQRLALEGPRG